MPIYEYECSACGHRLEALQKLSEAPLSECPECGKPALHKLISAAVFRLKGGGWYETDFKSGDKHHLADAGGGEKPPEAAAKLDKLAEAAPAGDKSKADKPTADKAKKDKSKAEPARSSKVAADKPAKTATS